MAASHTNRSPSPIAPTSRPINPSLRNSESSSTAVRRSFSAKPSVLTNPRRFDPTTPANSPSDLVRRHSVDSYPKEKENCEKDPNIKPSKFQPSAKGSKHFMSPTISAAYKFSPSPKKKVLVERNDPVRTSISLSDGKAMFFSTQSPNVSVDLELKSKMGYEKGPRTESSLDLNGADLANKQAVQEGSTRVSKPSKKVTFSDVPSYSETLSESITMESDSSKMELHLKNEIPCSWDSSSIAPLDADPSLPPYDPKTNYLSPRPQFLHYKPNPRVGILLNKEKGLDADELRQLEDSLLADILSESFSDSDGAEDTLSEDLLKEEMGVIISDDLVVGVEEGIKYSPCASESSEPSSLIGTDLPNAVFVDNNAANEKEKKPRLVSRLVCFSLIMMLLIACGSVFVFYSPPAFKEIALTEMRSFDVSKLYDQSKHAAAASAKMNFDRLLRHVNQQFLVDSLSYIFNVVNDFGKGEDTGSLQFTNISSVPRNDEWIRGGFLNIEEVGKEIVQEDLEGDRWNREGFLNEEVRKDPVKDLEEDGEFEDDIDSEETEVLDDSEEDDELEEVADAERSISEEEGAYSEVDYSEDNLEEEYGTSDEVSEAENVCPDCVNTAEFNYEDSGNIEDQNVCPDCVNTAEFNYEDSGNIEDQNPADAEMDRLGVTLQPQDRELHEDVASGMAKPKSHPSMDEKIPLNVNSLTEVIQSTLPTEAPPSEDKFRMHYGMVVSALISSLFAAAAAYAYHHKRNRIMPNVGVHENPLSLCKQMGHKDRKTHSQNWQQTETSRTSETSGFQNTAASYSVKEMREVTSEAQSAERKAKKYFSNREPLIGGAVSSSEYTTGSPSSYGSFTTFEKIPIKNNANRDEEVITPVRRSSRIRNHQQVTAP